MAANEPRTPSSDGSPVSAIEAQPRSRKVRAGLVLIVIGIALSFGTSLLLDGVLSAVFVIGPGMHNAPVAAAAYETVHGVAQASAFALIFVGLGLTLWNAKRGPTPSNGTA